MKSKSSVYYDYDVCICAWYTLGMGASAGSGRRLCQKLSCLSVCLSVCQCSCGCISFWGEPWRQTDQRSTEECLKCISIVCPSMLGMELVAYCRFLPPKSTGWRISIADFFPPNRTQYSEIKEKSISNCLWFEESISIADFFPPNRTRYSEKRQVSLIVCDSRSRFPLQISSRQIERSIQKREKYL